MSDSVGSNSASSGLERWLLAVCLLVSAIVGLTVLAIVVITNASFYEKAQTSMMVFNALVPLFGTWAGTVIAFYFSRENFESANRAVRQIAEQVSGDERLKGILVTSVMKPLAAMTVVKPPESGKLDDVTLQTINDLFSDVVTRLPLLDVKDVAQYIIHRSLFDQFKLKRADEGKPVVLATETVANLIADVDVKKLMENFSIEDKNATLAEAKASMAVRPKCQDVFITKSGQENESVLGWITNSDIVKHTAV